MPKVLRKLEIEEMTYSQSTLKTRMLPLTVYRALLFLLEVVHTNGASPSITAESLAGLISKINIVLNGQDTIVSVPFKHLYFMNKADFAQEPYKSLFTTASSQGTSKLAVILPFALTRAVVPEDTLLDCRNLASAVLEVQWGNSIGSGISSIDSARLKPYSIEYSNVAKNAVFARHEMGYAVEDITATGIKQVKLEVGSNNQYRRLWIYTRDSNDALSNSVLDQIGVKTRSFYFLNIDADAIRYQNQVEYNTTIDDGVYIIDFTADGKMTQRIDARNLSELVLEVESLVSDGSVEIVKEKAIYA